jgi:hypothetical protein
MRTARVSLEVLVDTTYAGTSVTNAATVQSPPTTPEKPGGELGDSGSPVGPGLLLVALALIAAGVGVLAATRSRRTRS